MGRIIDELKYGKAYAVNLRNRQKAQGFIPRDLGVLRRAQRAGRVHVGGGRMLGYAGENPAAAPGDVNCDEWRRTGDLVEVVGDRVLFRGRRSEVINVGGVNVHPLPVEERINGLDSVALARVFGRPSKLTGAIVAAEIVPAGRVEDADVERIRAQVKEVVADLPRAWQPRRVTFVDAIATKGGKTIRGMED